MRILAHPHPLNHRTCLLQLRSERIPDGLRSHPALESRVLVVYIVALSSIVLGIQRITNANAIRRVQSHLFGGIYGADQTPRGYIAQHGGPVIFAFQATRLLTNIGITLLAILAALSSYEVGRAAIAIAGAYTTLLSTVVLFKPITLSHRFATHSTIVALSIFVALVYRDMWPYGTFNLVPTDTLNPAFWMMLALSGASGALIPLLEPYPRIFAPQVESGVNPEETASILSWSLFFFLDPLIARARGVKHLDYALLPPAVASDALVIIQERATLYLDPFYSLTSTKEPAIKPRRINVLRGLLLTHRTSWLIQALLRIMASVAQIGAPIGTNRLLRYLEEEYRGNGAEALKLAAVRVRPWVWIAWIALAPLLQDVARQMYLLLNSRVIVHNEAVLTSLVYEHALRVRVVHAPDDVPDTAVDVTESSEESISVPVIAPEASEGLAVDTLIDSQESQEQGTLTRETTASGSELGLSVTDTATIAPSTSAPSSTKGDGSDKNKVPSAPSPTKKQQELTGRLNNFVTSDLANINGGKDFLEVLITVPLTVILGTWFLYSILGNAALVGLAVMGLFMPVPTWVTRKIGQIQKRKMGGTDVRVGAVSEALGVLRMIKMFGWEEKVKQDVEEKRKIELDSIFSRKMYDLVNLCSKWVLSGGRVRVLTSHPCVSAVSRSRWLIWSRLSRGTRWFSVGRSPLPSCSRLSLLLR
jgi:ABC-type multidrug transport system fused ATPase/permease subunit